jgi:dTDP-4-amino-4,6-dideoxygalactose transaminase
MFGNPAELDPLLELGVPVIEDCAQSLGAEYKSRQVGSLGEISVFSFYATKMITTGEGGMILTDDEQTHSRLIERRDYDRKALSPTRYNYKMTDIQAALGLAQLRKLHTFIEKRRHIASLYNDALSKCDIGLPHETASGCSVFYRYVVMLNGIEQVREKASNAGIACERPVSKPLHRHLQIGECPNSDKAYDCALSIPLYPSLSKEEIDHIVVRLGNILRD